ncbi:MAG: hypothetical protein Q8S26_03775 [Azonexus sp.]|nr:hypothetical protein [Azonexus sp.]
MNIATPPFLSRALITLSLIFASLSGQSAIAADEVVANPDTGKLFANVWRVRGEVLASGKLGVPRKLREGSPVYVGEQIRASSTGEAVLRTADAGIVAVRPGAEFVPERFAAEGKSTDRQILRLITGSLRLISGWIGQLNHPDHRVITPSATIGIRGTDHEPYVLPPEMATAVYRPGTYDKVNRGATSLEANGGNLLIDQGRVGFARDPNATAPRTRALITLLLPTLLAKVPDFYVPGAFDAELDRYSETADNQSQKQLESRQSGAKRPAPEKMAAAAPAEAEPAIAAPVGCNPRAIGDYWLGSLDRAIARRDLKTILGLFAPDVVARATIRSSDNKTSTLDFNRDELVQSTLSSIANLKDYQQRRISVEASLPNGETEATCQRLDVKSLVIEQGLMDGKPYRFESTEQYRLEMRNGEWLATQAETTQR